MTLQTKDLLFYFFLVTLLSSILWLISAFAGGELLPGLPVSSFMAFLPAAAAGISIALFRKSPNVRKIKDGLCFLFSVKRKAWIIPAVLLQPAIFIASFLVLRLSGARIPLEIHLNLFSTITFLLFFLAAFTEELGWTGFALPLMQEGFGWIFTGIVLGLFHSLWHYIPFFQVGRNLSWIFWQTIFLTSSRIIIIWLYNRSGKSMIIPVLFHAFINISWQLFPVQGTYYNPAVTGSITAVVAAGIIWFEWIKPNNEI
ncbi:CPBP family intramembrane glutamic endopeptidase [Spirochaeta lutea]|uniref:CPBP family intramembrane glutamic endopeptidase n=1 Tax=Spirochaeta lutea TaxID=1480694 RepID=UPI000691D4A7|nr:CPBP family glutamic-type intramembrane protease [Spirochaeta lutea]